MVFLHPFPQLHGVKPVGVAKKLQSLADRPMGAIVMFQSNFSSVMHATEHLHDFFFEFLMLVN